MVIIDLYSNTLKLTYQNLKKYRVFVAAKPAENKVLKQFYINLIIELRMNTIMVTRIKIYWEWLFPLVSCNPVGYPDPGPTRSMGTGKICRVGSGAGRKIKNRPGHKNHSVPGPGPATSEMTAFQKFFYFIPINIRKKESKWITKF